MSEELKSYLGNIKYEIETSDIELEKLDLGLSAIMWEELLDYINNLQKQLHQASLDIQELTEKDIGCPSWCDKLTNLQEETERQSKAQVILDNQIAEMLKYKQRNEKAIEYINHENFKRNILVGVSTKKYTRDILNNVLNILKGDKDE